MAENKIIHGDCIAALRGLADHSVDLVFADPPYDLPKLGELPRLIREGNWLAEGGWFILEHGERDHFDAEEGFKLTRKYGHVHFSLFTFD